MFRVASYPCQSLVASLVLALINEPGPGWATPNATTKVRSYNDSSGIAARCRSSGSRLDITPPTSGSRADCSAHGGRDLFPRRKNRLQRRTRPADASGSLFMGCGCCPAAGTGGQRSFEEAGCTPLTPGWPDDPNTVEEAKAHPGVFADKTVGQVADHFSDVIGQPCKKPAVPGHPFGGLLTQIVAGRGLSGRRILVGDSLEANT